MKNKHTTSRNLLRRYVWLANTIDCAGEITFKEISDRWLRETDEEEELPLRTFHNHRNAIEEILDINIECNKQKGFVYYIENRDDIKLDGIRRWLLSAFSVNNLIHESHKLKHRILFEEIPSGLSFLVPVIEAMRDGRTMEITHQGFRRNEPKTFEIEPYCVKIFKQRWYVVARNPYCDELRVYALDRIKELHATDRTFKLPKNFDAQALFYNTFGVTMIKDAKPPTVKIKVFGDQRNYFRTLPLHATQKETETAGDYCVFSYEITPTHEFRKELLSYGNEIEVLSPEWFRTEIKEIALKMNAMYGK
ncbi:MAG: WYL domain-containing protein [Tannerella sp.]|jgi:hypothetical protein|nr:WYL domain-containing protein [Tannerella sp.]